MTASAIFIGREKERERISQLIMGRDRCIICVKGRSKMGKTRLLEKIYEDLADEPQAFSTMYKFHSALEDPFLPFVISLGELVRTGGMKEGLPDKARLLVQALASEPTKTALRMGGAVYRAARAGILSKVKEYFEYEEILEEVASIFEEKIKQAGEADELDKILADARPAVISSYLGLMENLSENAHPEDRYVLIFDQIEDAPEGALDFLITLGRQLPPHCYLIFSLNIEHPRGAEIWRKRESEFRAHDVQVMDMVPFGQREIRQLIQARGKIVPNPVLLKRAERATGGRPLSLDDWIRSQDFDPRRIRKDGRFQVYQIQRLDACTREARTLARVLALMPTPLPRGLKDYTLIMEASTVDVEEWFRELSRQHLFSRTGDEYWFVHGEIQETIVSDTPQHVRGELAEKLIVGLEAIDSEVRERTSAYNQILATILPWTNDHERTYTLNYQWGRLLDLRSEFIAAWEHYDRALRAAEVISDKQKQNSCLIRQGWILFLWGHHDEALDKFSQCLDINREARDRAGEARTLKNVARVHSAKAQYWKALDYHEQALAINREVGDRREEATILANIGEVHSALGKTKQGLVYYEQALAINREVGDRREEAGNLNNIGLAYTVMEQNDEALVYYRQALPIRRELKHLAGVATTLNNIGLAYSGLGQNNRAVEFYEEALAMSREVGYRVLEATVLNNLGRIYLKLDQKDKALEMHKQSLAISHEVGDRPGEAVVLRNIASILTDQGELAEAVSVMKKVVAILKEMRHPDLEEERADLRWLRRLLRKQQGAGRPKPSNS